MLRPYRELLATPGGLRFSTSAFVARMPISMIGLGVVLLVVSETGRYGEAGALSATFALAEAAGAPLVSRLVDQRGQSTVLAPAVAAHLVALTAFIVLASTGGPLWTQFLTAAVAGLTLPSMGSLVRARWGFVLGDDPRLHTAYAYESVLDELIFVVGPLLVTVIATTLAPQAALFVAAGLLVAGTAALLTHRASEPPASGHGGDHPSALRDTGLPVLMLVMVFVGGVFGAVEISTVAFADEHGHRALAGPLLACYAAGSLTSGFVFGSIRGGYPPRRSLLVGAGVMTVTVSLLPFVGSVWLLAVLLVLAGVGIAPTLISGFTLVEKAVPASAVTEGLTWATTGLVVGFSASTWLAGRLVDSAGVGWAFAVGALSGFLALLIARATYRRLPA